MERIRSFQKLNELSVFFPCYNEEENIEQLLEQALFIVPNIAHKYEIIVINDGSTDRTSEIAHKFANKYSSIKIVDQKNSGGYGGAVKSGFKHVKYEWVFFTDADLQFDLKDLYKFVEASRTGEDLIIGYRIKRAEGIKRQFFATGMKIWSKLFLGFPMFIKDTDCAFKLIKKQTIDSVGRLHSDSNLVTTEFLLGAYKRGYKFKQIGVEHYKRVAGESTCGGISAVVHVILDTKNLMEVFYIKPAMEKLMLVLISIKNILQITGFIFTKHS